MATPQSGLTRVPTQPPRMSGNADEDVRSLSSWIQTFYESGVIQNYFENTISKSSSFTPESLPDPANTNAATAQETANEAYILANAAEAKTRGWVTGHFQITETDDTYVFSFSDEQEDAQYRILLTRVGESSVAAGADHVVSVAKTENDFTVTFDSAPGAGETADWDFLVCRG